VSTIQDPKDCRHQDVRARQAGGSHQWEPGPGDTWFQTSSLRAVKKAEPLPWEHQGVKSLAAWAGVHGTPCSSHCTSALPPWAPHAWALDEAPQLASFCIVHRSLCQEVTQEPGGALKEATLTAEHRPGLSFNRSQESLLIEAPQVATGTAASHASPIAH
jgi:hypothetical protein